MKLFAVSVFLGAIVSLFTFSAPGASPHFVSNYSSRLWQTDNGLPHNSVTAICQTSDDYLWVGTARGLARFDGVYFKTFAALENVSVAALLPGQNGTLWIGTATNGLIEFRNGEFLPHILPGGTEANSVKSIVENRDGSLLIGTGDGLVRFSRGQFSFVADSPRAAVLAISKTGDDLWIGTSDGLLLLKNEKLTSVSLPVSGGHKSVRALNHDRQSNLWIGSDETLIRRQDGQSSVFGPSDGLSAPVTALHEDRYGTVWIGLANGLCRVNGSRLVPKLDESERSFESVFCLHEDREGNVWAGTAEGLVQLRPKPFNAITREEGLSHGNVASVVEDQAGNIWIATSGGGLNRLDATDGKITSFGRTTSDLSESLLALRPGPAGLWVSSDNGLFRFRDGLSINYSAAFDLSDSVVQTVFEDSTDTLWAGARDGLYRYQNGNSRRYTVADGLPGENIRAITEDHQGNIWFGTEGGLAIWKQNRFTAFTVADGLSANFILSLCEDRDFNLWIGTAGGLNRFKNGKFTSYTTRDGLFNDNILEIIEDDFGNLWMSSVGGVFRVKKKEFDDLAQGISRVITSISFGRNDGMPSPQCSGLAKPGAWKSRDGRLWFATSRGVAVIDPSRLEKESTPPKIVIGEMLADGKSVEISKGEKNPGIVVPPGRGEIQFRFAALSFQAPEKNRFKFKLEGVDPNWVDAGTRCIAYYNNIRPGRYTFQVQGGNSEGVWNAAATNVKFTLEPHYWQTWWFKTSVILFSLSSVGTAARYVTRRRMQQRLQRLEQQNAVERERTRIAQDMHDDLGARLSEILVLSNPPDSEEEPANPAARQLKRISTATRDLVDNLDAIVWAVNPKHDTLESFVAYLDQYVPSYFESTPVRCFFEVPDSLPRLSLSSETRHNLFLVVKEALHNILKHAQASEVRLHLRLENGKLFLALTDNGRGFASKEGDSFGNGLVNMTDRMKQIGGNCCIRSEPARGTEVLIELPVEEQS